MVDIGTRQLSKSSSCLHVAPLPLGGMDMKRPSPDMECSQTDVHITSKSVPLDEQVRMEKRAHAVAKSVRRRLRRDRKEGSLLDSVEKGVFLLSRKAVAAIASYSLVCFKTRIAKHDNETFRTMVTLRNRQTLFGC